jgi:hypothetical protein
MPRKTLLDEELNFNGYTTTLSSPTYYIGYHVQGTPYQSVEGLQNKPLFFQGYYFIPGDRLYLSNNTSMKKLLKTPTRDSTASIRIMLSRYQHREPKEREKDRTVTNKMTARL